MRTFGANKLTKNVRGHIRPCHSPAQKPAGCAPGTRYFDPGPAIANTFIRERLVNGPFVGQLINWNPDEIRLWHGRQLDGFDGLQTADQRLAYSMHPVHNAPFGIDDYRVIQASLIDQLGVFRDSSACWRVAITGEPESLVEFPNPLQRQINRLLLRRQTEQPVDVPSQQPTL